MLKIGIGYENYKRIIDDGCYFVDKTLLIKDFVDKSGMVTLFTRPRRFGKNLALSMLRTFFELEYDRDGNTIDKKHYFEGKKIEQCKAEILSKMGQYPVIMLSLKSAKKQDFNNSFLALRDNIIDEFDRHSYLMNSTVLSSEDIEIFTRFYKGKSIWDKKRKSITDKTEYNDALDDRSYGKKYKYFRLFRKLLSWTFAFAPLWSSEVFSTIQPRSGRWPTGYNSLS